MHCIEFRVSRLWLWLDDAVTVWQRADSIDDTLAGEDHPVTVGHRGDGGGYTGAGGHGRAEVGEAPGWGRS